MSPAPLYALFGITGNIGSGKSQFAEFIRECGGVIVDADILSREVVKKGSQGLSEIAAHFGKNFLLPNGELNRKALGALIFTDREKRKQLERIVHPQIRKLFEARVRELSHTISKPTLIFYVVPLLFESDNKYPELQKVIVVASTKEVSLTRIMARDKCSKEIAEQRYASQIPIEEKEKLADIVVRNDGTLDDLRKQAREVYADLSTTFLT